MSMFNVKFRSIIVVAVARNDRGNGRVQLHYEFNNATLNEAFQRLSSELSCYKRSVIKRIYVDGMKIITYIPKR